ncbi:MAG: hypothetical protein AAGI22_05120 [Planctomycetota bacterium]
MPEGGSFDHDLEGIPQVRKGPPRWMMLTGCGCLIPGFIGVAILAFGAQMVGTLVNQDHAWSQLGLIVPFDDAARGERTGTEDNPATALDESREPREFELIIGGAVPMSGGVEAYSFSRGVPGPMSPDREMGDDPMLVTFVKLKADQANAATRAPTGTPLQVDMTLEVQGRELRGRRIPEMISDDVMLRIARIPEVRGAGAVIWLREGFTDPDEKGELFDLLVFFQRYGSSDPIGDDEIRSFLEPFDVAAAQTMGEPLASETEESADDDSAEGADDSGTSEGESER